MWDDQFEAFAGKYRVIRYDLRGFGQSALPKATEYYTRSEDLKAPLKHLGIGRATIVGLSMGGSVAISFVLVYPEMARDLILADSTLVGYDWSSEWKSSIEAVESKAESEGEKAANALWLKHPLFAPAREKPGVAARLDQMVHDYSGWHRVNHDPHLESNPPDIQKLSEVRSPSLIILGERDLMDFHTIAGILQNKIPEACMSRFQGAGHMANMEAPERFNQVAVGFLRTHHSS